MKVPGVPEAPRRDGWTGRVSDRTLAFAFVGFATLVRIVLAALVPLFPDETYYWEWSRHLAAGYFDHPPAIAFLIRAGTLLFGASRFGVRAGVILVGAVASISLFSLGGRLAGDALSPTAGSRQGGARSRAAALLAVIPAALVGFVLATPDAPLLGAVAVTLLALDRALATERGSREALGWWIASGIALGLAFVSKYTAVLVPVGVLIALLLRSSLRPRLKELGPYAAAVVALLVFAPTLLWNARHDWISFAFQLQHGLGATRGFILTRELNLFGGQLGLVTPILAVLAGIVVVRSLRRDIDDRRFVVAVVATTVFTFFVLSAIRRPVEPNWPAPALIAAIPLLASWNRESRHPEDGPHTTTGRWLLAGIALAVLVSAFVVVHAVAGIPRLAPRRDPVARSHGWDDLGRSVARAAAVQPASGCATTWIAADRYQDASELAFHLPAQPRVFALNLGGRRNQYELWPGLSTLIHPDDCLLLVTDTGPAGDAIVGRLDAASAVSLSPVTMLWDGQPVGRRSLWLLRGIEPGFAGGMALPPAARAAVDSASAAFTRTRSLFDSVATIFRHGPAPYLVAATDTGPPLSNADRRPAIATRVGQIRSMLSRASAVAVYRDARYRECTFVRLQVDAALEVGYVEAPDGCRLRAPGITALYTRHIAGAWYVYAASATHTR